MRWEGLVLAGGLLLQQAGSSPAPVERKLPQAPTIRVETRLVNVALNIVDAHEAPVSGVQMDDLEVREDGQIQKIAVFEKESSTPLSIVLAIDTSESVFGEAKLEREAAKHFVAALLRPQDEVELTEFADTVQELVPFTNQAKRFDDGLGRLHAGDATAVYNSIYVSSQRLAETKNESGRRRVLVLITDGENTVKGGWQYSEAVEQAQRAGAMVYALILVPVEADAGRNVGGEHALITMTEDTGGKYYYVGDPRDLDGALKHVSDDLRTQYVLGYYAPQRGKDDSYRSIKITMKDPALAAQYKLRYRTGYYADAH